MLLEFINMEEEARLQHGHIENDIVDQELGWIPDTDTDYTWDTKYFRTIDLYWHMKSLLGQALFERD